MFELQIYNGATPMVTVKQLQGEHCTTRDMYDVLQQDVASFHADAMIWIDMQDPTEAEEQDVLSKWFGVNDYVLEDARTAVKTSSELGWDLHPPKVEEFPGFLFLVYRAVYLPKATQSGGSISIVNQVAPRQISVLIAKGVLITHVVGHANAIESLRRKVDGNPQMMKRGPDYIAALLADAIVDDSFDVNEAIAKKFDELEKSILRKTSTLSVVRLQRTRRLLLQYRSSALRMTDMIGRMARSNTSLIDKPELLIFRDVHDHIHQAVEQIDLLISESSNLIELHFSMANSRLNEVMRRLTALSTIFMPITFVTSWYGMNFRHMPELAWEMSYPVLLSIIVILIAVLLAIFRKRGWLA